MNRIEAQMDRSDYGIHTKFLNYQVDGKWLDEKLDALFPTKDLKGLIPSLLFWLEKKQEQALVWDRILPEAGDQSICPILMCPEDCTFNYSLVVAEIHNTGNSVLWTKLGIDHSPGRRASRVGNLVDWFSSFQTLEFSFSDYESVLWAFDRQFKKDYANYRLLVRA